MANAPDRSKRKFHFKWRAVAVCALTVLGIASLVGFMVAHWVERQVLTTDNWVAMVSPLPKNAEVAGALSDYSVNKLFTATDLEQRIGNALPDRASFLAPTLADQLQSRLTNRTSQFIQSDQFQSVWRTANEKASERLLSRARGETPAAPSGLAKFDLDLASVKDKINELLDGNVGSAAATERPVSGDKDVGLGVGLRTSVEKFKTFVKTTDFLNATLGLLALVCLLGALVISHSRRRLLLIFGLLIVAVALLQLIAVKAGRSVVLEQVQNVSYQPAVGVVYDTLLDSFRRSSTVVVIIGLAISLIAYLLRPSILNRNKTITGWLESLYQSSLWLKLREFRMTVRRHILQIVGIVVLLGLLLMAFVLSLDWQGTVRSILFILFAIEIIGLVSARTEEMPMKQ